MNLLRRLLGEMETPRLVLRHWRESDLEDFLAFAADPAVMLDSAAPRGTASPLATSWPGPTGAAAT